MKSQYRTVLLLSGVLILCMTAVVCSLFSLIRFGNHRESLSSGERFPLSHSPESERGEYPLKEPFREKKPSQKFEKQDPSVRSQKNQKRAIQPYPRKAILATLTEMLGATPELSVEEENKIRKNLIEADKRRKEEREGKHKKKKPKYHPSYLRWLKNLKRFQEDHELAWRELESFSPDAHDAFRVLMSGDARKEDLYVSQLRSRVLDKLPDRLKGSDLHFAILRRLQIYGYPLYPWEIKVLYKKAPTLDPEHPLNQMRRDSNGDITLREIGRFSEHSYRAISYLERFPHRIPALRQIVDIMPQKQYNSVTHLEILATLILYGEAVTPQEENLVREKYSFPYPTKIEIYSHTKIKERALREHQRGKKESMTDFFIHMGTTKVRLFPPYSDSIQEDKEGNFFLILNGKKYQVFEEKRGE